MSTLKVTLTVGTVLPFAVWYGRGTKEKINFFRTGSYSRSGGFMYERATFGHWWSIAAGSATGGYYLDTYPIYVTPQNNSYRGKGYAVRCVVWEG